ncbi:histone H2A deubiquitinase MYSM1-like isoform X2 [Acanthaster planci]|nr:histone H2A deubiquitinase MYSM1-like isoform X2 [Acanthaster planci]
MDLESRLTIENMLHEERRYLRTNNGPITRRLNKKKSSPHLRWTPHERLQFEQGYRNYGNRWTEIARLIPTRSPLQVKNYARNYFPKKMKSPSDVSADVHSQDLVNRDGPDDEAKIHSHLPESLDTGSPTVPTRLHPPCMRHAPCTSRRRHFQKFGFANLSPSRLLKSRSGKDALASIKIAKERSVQRAKAPAPKGSRPDKRLRKGKQVHRAKGRGTKAKAKDERTLGQSGHLRDQSRDATEGSSAGLFEQGGGVIRMRPEGSEDEDVDVEDDTVGGDTYRENLLMGLAVTCDRIYNNLITPSGDPTVSATLSLDMGQKDASAKNKAKTLPNVPRGSKVRDHKVIPEGLCIPELAWNADHTYSMSVRTLHKLGILGATSNSTQNIGERATGSYCSRQLSQGAVLDSDNEAKTFIKEEPDDIPEEEEIFPLKSEPVDSPEVLPQDGEIGVDFKTEPEESEVVIWNMEPTECHVQEEPCDVGSYNSSALGQEDVGQVMDMCEHIETHLSKEQDAGTPLSGNSEVQPSDTPTDSSVPGSYREHELEGCVSSEGSRAVPQPVTVPAPLENNPGNPEAEMESEEETGGLNHEDGNRGGIEDLEKEESVPMPGEEDSNSGEDKKQEAGPSRECHLQLDQIEDWEKGAMPEFFEGRPAKTPQRYLKIRNYIYQLWLQTKPKYLNKAVVRQGLKNCGDVNSIGHIHRSLETAGAINHGVANPHRAIIECRASAIRQRSTSKTNEPEAPRESKRPRKKRIFHLESEIGLQSEEKLLPRKSVRSGTRKSKPVAYDPFKLIECCKFTEETEAPFHVRIQSDAMVIMDVHSHMSSTEVIGLLGGKFSKEDSILDVLLAVPCNSISTGMQCEMDPVSQTEAYESIRAKGYQVVGWYHSHPAFAANPSVRDIETQSGFQGWFSQGGAPFIGIIISPCHNYQVSQSKVCCLTVSKDWSPELKCRKPYQFDFTISHSHCDDVLTMNTISSVVTKFAIYKHRSEMLCLWSKFYDISFLEKMLLSIKTYMCPNQQEDLLRQIKDFITAEFTTKTAATIKEENDS